MNKYKKINIEIIILKKKKIKKFCRKIDDDSQQFDRNKNVL